MELTRSIVSELSEGVTASHKLATLVEVLEDGEPIFEAETVTDGSVTLDSRASSRGRMDATIIDDGTLGLIPTEAEDLFAPYGNEIRISRGIETEDAIELVRLGVYRIDTADVSESGDGLTIRLSGNDRSARIIDGKFEDPYQVASATQAVTAITAAIQAVWDDVPLGDFLSVSVALPALYAVKGEDRWAFVQGIATALGAELYFDGEGNLTLQPVPSPITGTPIAEFSEGDGGVLLGADKSWSRLGTFNVVDVTGEATDSSAAPPTARAEDTNALSPTYAYGSFGRVPDFWSSQFITTADQAATAAAARLATVLGTSQSISSTTIEDPARKPSDIVRINRPRMGIEEEIHVLDSVTHNLSPSSSMSAQTRVAQGV